MVQPFARHKLGPDALVRGLRDAVPEADADALTEALTAGGEQGLLATITGLGLPEVVTRFLHDQIPAAEVPGAVELDPMTVADAVRRAMDEAADEARAHVEHMREVADGAREQAAQMQEKLTLLTQSMDAMK